MTHATLRTRVGLVLALTASWSARISAQQTPPDSARDAPFTLALGIVSRVPGIGDAGRGPQFTATLRARTGRLNTRVLVAASYALVFTEGYRDPTGTRYDYSPEGVILGIGPEWSFGARRAVALDVQWNPALTRIRRWGAVPPYVRSTRSWTRESWTGSVGAHWMLPLHGPMEVGIGGRLYADPRNFALGGIGAWSTLHVTVGWR